MATTTTTREDIMAGSIPTPFISGGKVVKVTKEERDELARLGVNFDDAPEPSDDKTEGQAS
jgi:hypothetical protein